MDYLAWIIFLLLLTPTGKSDDDSGGDDDDSDSGGNADDSGGDDDDSGGGGNADDSGGDDDDDSDSGGNADDSGGDDEMTFIQQTDEGFLLTIQGISKQDEGKYKITTSAVTMAPTCVHDPYIVTVTGSNSEYLRPWSEWSFCIDQCSSHTLRSRSRECSIPGGCSSMTMIDTQSCDKAEHCSHWSDWGKWGSCSAKCGKGFRMRKRVCLNGNSSLVHNSQCRGVASQSQMCLTVCEVVGTWTEWSGWSNCSEPCNSSMPGTKTRHRTCSTDDGQRVVTENCTGNRTETQSCGGIACPESENDVTVPLIKTYRGHSYIMTIVSMAAGIICVVIILVVLLCVLCLRRRRQRRDSSPTLRPADSANTRRTKKKSTDRRSIPTNDPTESGNVYSDLTSGTCWPSNEFDSSYDIDSKAFSQHFGGNAVQSEIDNPEENCDDSDFDSDFDDVTDQPARNTMCERSEIIYETSRKSYQRHFSGDNQNITADKVSRASSEIYEVITENQLYEPPELWSTNDAMSFDSDVDMRTGSKDDIVNSGKQDGDEEAVYYEPPDESKEKTDIAEMKRKESEMTDESVYENFGFDREIMEMDEPTEIIENSYEIPAKRLSDIDDKIQDNNASDKSRDSFDENNDGVSKVRMRNGSIVTFDEKTNTLKYEPIYANAKMMRESGNFYVTPKYTYGLSMNDSKPNEDHIYDIPKSPN
ncbi:hypothetical protein ACF0H5_023407 [Mactra antiquata]